MDIIIRNGVIQSNESNRVYEIKNNAGLLKKDYKDYIKEFRDLIMIFWIVIFVFHENIIRFRTFRTST